MWIIQNDFVTFGGNRILIRIQLSLDLDVRTPLHTIHTHQTQNSKIKQNK